MTFCSWASAKPAQHNKIILFLNERLVWSTYLLPHHFTTMATEQSHLEQAGNHGDVLKHMVLQAAIKAQQKAHPEGIIFVDTHCGAGVYDLGEQASGEYEKGIMKIAANIDDAPQPVADYFNIVKANDEFLQQVCCVAVVPTENKEYVALATLLFSLFSLLCFGNSHPYQYSILDPLLLPKVCCVTSTNIGSVTFTSKKRRG